MSYLEEQLQEIVNNTKELIQYQQEQLSNYDSDSDVHKRKRFRIETRISIHEYYLSKLQSILPK